MNGRLDFCEQALDANLSNGNLVNVPIVNGVDARPPIDLASLLRRCLDDTTFCGMILHKFASRAADQIAALERAIDSGNTIDLAREAHTLVGVAANLSAQTLCDRAKQLELSASSQDLSAARTALEHTRAELHRCVEIVPELLDRVSR